MIRFIENINMLLQYKKSDMFSVRIMSLAMTYGFKYDFIRFYVQIENAQVASIFSYMDKDITISCDFNLCDTNEIIEFLYTTGFNSLLSDYNLNLPYSCNDGEIMLNTDNNDLYANSEIEKNIVTDFSLEDLYRFLDLDIDFEYWYTDINHRLRHKGAKMYLVVMENKIISSSLLTFIYESNAVLSSVKTFEKMRNNGYCSALITHILNDFQGNVYLMRENNANYTFYYKLGFRNIGKWKMYLNSLK